MTSGKPLSNTQMALGISVALLISAVPVYLAIKGNPWPCIALLVASKVFLMWRKK